MKVADLLVDGSDRADKDVTPGAVGNNLALDTILLCGKGGSSTDWKVKVVLTNGETNIGQEEVGVVVGCAGVSIHAQEEEVGNGNHVVDGKDVRCPGEGIGGHGSMLYKLYWYWSNAVGQVPCVGRCGVGMGCEN